MRRTLHLTIPTPCHERWDAMTATERGAFCHSCVKEVIDFSAMTDSQVIQYLERHKTGCGRFREDQLGRDMSLPKANNSLMQWKVLLMGLLPAFSLAPVAARAVVPVHTDQTPPKSKGDTAATTIDTTATTCDKVGTGVCGRVVDTHGQGLSAASVRLIDAEGKRLGSTMTDTAGYFSVALEAGGTVTIHASSLGYATRTLTDIQAGHPYVTIQMKTSEPYIIYDTITTGYFAPRRTTAQKIRDWFHYTFRRRHGD
ncbi:MAG: carboxypeptidase regulatory-like domain-containing protein [Bacteroidetes bacterium]|nr:carboxypeptidase regulatory-like domain-containing protein [Bacteroidota bacterium]